jgi:hypothetical protein
MAAILTLLVITLVSLVVVRTGATALMLTGLSWDVAHFQSYSAFFGVGFTTREAEMVVNHPIRRRIIRDLILAGNIGLTSALATLIATLMQNPNGAAPFLIVLVVVCGLAFLLYLTRVRWVQKWMDYVIQISLRKAGVVKALDYELLLRVHHGFVVLEVDVLQGNPLAGLRLKESRPWDHEVIVLAIHRDGEKLKELPNAETNISAGDALTVYGRESKIRELFDLNSKNS